MADKRAKEASAFALDNYDIILFLPLAVFYLLGSYLTPPLCLEVFVSRYFFILYI